MGFQFLRNILFFITLSSVYCHAYELTFIPIDIKTSDYNISVTGVAKSDSGEINVDITLDNTSKTDITLDDSLIELVTQQGWRAPAVANDSHETYVIAAKTKQHISLTFQPINSMELYQLLKISGDFKQQYVLHLPLSNGQSRLLPITLAFTNKHYQDYLAEAAQEKKLQLQLPVIQADDFIAKQSTYMKQTFTDAHSNTPSIVALPQQIVINGQVFQWRAFQQQEKLSIRLQVVNHNPQELVLDIPNIMVELGDKTFRPTNNFSTLPSYMQTDVLENTHFTQYRVKPGKRLDWTFNYEIPATNGLQLNMAGIQINHKPLFSQKLSFAPIEEAIR